MNKLNETNFIPLSRYSDFEKEEIINKNNFLLRKFVMDNCNDYQSLNESVELIIKNYNFSEYLKLPITNKIELNEGFVIENLSSSLDTLIKLEKNKEKLDMLLKSKDIYNIVLNVTNNKLKFVIVLLEKLHIISHNRLGYYSNVSTDIKNILTLITKNTNREDIKLRAEKLKFPSLYGNVSEDTIKNLVLKFTLEQKDELKDFVDYIAEKIVDINEMIQEKLEYIGSEEHFREYLHNNAEDLLFNKDGLFITRSQNFKGE
jgi:hypothetical protein